MAKIMRTDELAQAALIITANQRQALDVRRRWSLPEGRVLPLATFIEQSWRQLVAEDSPTPRWLSPFEQQVVWQRFISKDSTFVFKQDDALAKACREAFAWLSEWQVPLKALQDYATPNSEWFYRLAKRYLAACHEHHWVDNGQALTYLIEHAAAFALMLPKTLVFYRFWQVPTALQHLQTALAAAGVECRSYQPTGNAQPQTWRVEADSVGSELATLVQWTCLQASLKPQQSFACVIPDLHEHRASLEYYLHTFATPALLAEVHFSLGKALIDYPLIQVAWRLIKFNPLTDIALDDLIYLSHSPFWQHRAAIEVLISQWRQQQLAIFPPAAWRELASSELLVWRESLQAVPTTKALPSVWCERWQQRLSVCAWPQVALVAGEIAVAERFERVLATFAALDDFLGVLTQSEALHQWQALLTQTIFEPPSHRAPRLYFLGLLEALGSDFDNLWLSDVTRYRWPSLPRASALIPLKCQEAYQLPGSRVGSQLDVEQRVWQAFSLMASDQWVVSHATLRGAELQLGVTQVESWPCLVVDRATPGSDAMEERVQPCMDTQALPCSPENPFVPGGTAALRAQAHCPFQALARYRLGLRALPEVCMALTSSERGILVHQALQQLWAEIGNHAALIALTHDALRQQVTRVCRIALANLSQWRRRVLAQTLQVLEQQRLEKLLLAWLALEKTRPPFRVMQVEQTLEIAFAGKMWRLRPDRIDQLATGEYLVVDYKTGLSAINWQAEPLLEPQLPFYALLNPEPITALVVAHVTSRVKRIVGVAKEPIDVGLLGQLPAASDWSAQCQRWYDALSELATAYIAGEAAVRPAKGAATCQRCDLQAVCRVADHAGLLVS